MRNIANIISHILEEIPSSRITQEFIKSLVELRDKSSFVPEEAMAFYWGELSNLTIDTLKPQEGGMQEWENNVINILLGV